MGQGSQKNRGGLSKSAELLRHLSVEFQGLATSTAKAPNVLFRAEFNRGSDLAGFCISDTGESGELKSVPKGSPRKGAQPSGQQPARSPKLPGRRARGQVNRSHCASASASLPCPSHLQQNRRLGALASPSRTHPGGQRTQSVSTCFLPEGF